MGLIYFIKDEHKRVKLGHTQNGISRRLKSLQTANADLLEILGVIPGTRKKEARLQKRFQLLHIRGEWYKLEGALKKYIEQHAKSPFPERDYRIIKVYPDGSRQLQKYVNGIPEGKIPKCPVGCELEVHKVYFGDC